MAARMTPDEINLFLRETFTGGEPPTIEFADGKNVRARVRYHPAQIRPGGTLSGPTMMALADVAAYALVFSAIGLEPLAVTSDLTIHFLRKPKPADLIGEGRLLKLGRSLAVVDVVITSEGAPDKAVAHAVVTYALPATRNSE